MNPTKPKDLLLQLGSVSVAVAALLNPGAGDAATSLGPAEHLVRSAAEAVVVRRRLEERSRIPKLVLAASARGVIPVGHRSHSSHRSHASHTSSMGRRPALPRGSSPPGKPVVPRWPDAGLSLDWTTREDPERSYPEPPFRTDPDTADRMASIAAAIRANDLPALKRHLGSDGLALRDAASGRTPLHLAAQQSRTAILEFLLANGADPNARDSLGAAVIDLIPIPTSVESASMHCFAALLKHGAKADGGTPRPSTVRCLLALPPSQATDQTRSAAGRAIEQLLRLLLKKGADPNARQSKAQSNLLLSALHRGHLGLALLLLGQGADPASVNQHGQGVLHLLASHPRLSGSEPIATLVLRSGVSPYSTDKDGRTALECAVQWGHAPLAAYLRKRGIKR